jgi:hypothetical protein
VSNENVAASAPVHRLVGPFVYSLIQTEADITAARDRMSAKYYPVDMEDCEVVGINGDCGEYCPVLLRGLCSCPCADEMRPIALLGGAK